MRKDLGLIFTAISLITSFSLADAKSADVVCTITEGSIGAIEKKQIKISLQPQKIDLAQGNANLSLRLDLSNQAILSLSINDFNLFSSIGGSPVVYSGYVGNDQKTWLDLRVVCK